MTVVSTNNNANKTSVGQYILDLVYCLACLFSSLVYYFGRVVCFREY